MAVLFALLSVLSTGVGGVVALRNRDRLHLILGFTAGVLLGLVLFDLVPELFSLPHQQVGGVPLPMLTAAGGFLVLHLGERGLAIHAAHEAEYERHAHRDRHRHDDPGTGRPGDPARTPAVGLASALGLVTHSFLDGVGIGAGFQVGSAVGLAVALAVVAHDFADGLNTVSIMLSHGNSDRRARALLVADAVAPLLGAASTLVVRVPDTVLAGYLGFFAGFLLYLATSDILPEAHAHHPSRLTLTSTAAGIGLMWVVVALG